MKISYLEDFVADVGCMLADFLVVRPHEAECLVNVPLEFPSVL
jgi:hypothetical protein